jgi:hypothetical protein
VIWRHDRSHDIAAECGPGLMKQHLHRTGVAVFRILDFKRGAIGGKSGAHAHRHTREKCPADCRCSGKNHLRAIFLHQLRQGIHVNIGFILRQFRRLHLIHHIGAVTGKLLLCIFRQRRRQDHRAHTATAAALGFKLARF